MFTVSTCGQLAATRLSDDSQLIASTNAQLTNQLTLAKVNKSPNRCLTMSPILNQHWTDT